MSNTKLLLTALSLVVAINGSSACSCDKPVTQPRPTGQDIVLTATRERIPLAPQRKERIEIVATLGRGGAAVGGFRIDAAAESKCRVRLLRDSETTDDQGKALFDIEAGDQAEVCRLRFSGERAESVFVEIDVNGRFGGNIVVRSGYSGTVRIARLEVRLHDGRSACDARWAQLQDLPRGLPQPIQTATTPSVTQDARFNNLTEGSKYIATVVAKNALDRPVAYGCGDPKSVVAGRDTVINVRLENLQPTVQGKYRFGQEIDLLGFLDQGSTTYHVLKTIYNILDNPARGVAYGIVTPENPANGLCALIGGPMGPTAENNWAIPPLCATAAEALDALLVAGLSAIDDLAVSIKNTLHYAARMLARPRFGGYLEIKTFNPVTKEWTGEYRFDSFNFMWEIGTPWCKDNPNPCCAHQIFDGNKIGLVALTAAVKGKIEPEQTGGFALSYKLTMDEQALSIAVGSIVQALLESALLPAIMPADFPGREDGKVTLGELVSGLVYKTNCNSDSFCNSLKGMLDALLSTLANSLKFDGDEKTNIKQRIEVGKIQDLDDDLQLDDLVATIITTPMAGGSTTPMASSVTVYGRYEGRTCTGDTGVDTPENKYCNAPTTTVTNDPFSANLQLACRFAQNPIDGCFASNFCGVPEGTRRGGENCIADNECYSGTCMKRPTGLTYTNAQVDKCFKACTIDQDCQGEGSCMEDGFVFQRGTAPNLETTVTGTCVRTTTPTPTPTLTPTPAPMP